MRLRNAHRVWRAAAFAADAQGMLEDSIAAMP